MSYSFPFVYLSVIKSIQSLLPIHQDSLPCLERKLKAAMFTGRRNKVVHTDKLLIKTRYSYQQTTVKPGLAVTRFQRSLFVWGHFEVLPMHFKRYFNLFQRSPVERGQRPVITARNRFLPLFSAAILYDHMILIGSFSKRHVTSNYKQIDRYTGTIGVM